MLSIINHKGNANQNHDKITTSHLLRWLLFLKREVGVGEDVEELEPYGLQVGTQHVAATVENSLVVPQKVKT